MSPSKTGRTLNTLIRLGRALTDTDPTDTRDPVQAARQAASSVLRGPVDSAAERLRAAGTEARTRLGERADARLERLITERRAGQDTRPDPEALAVLARRRAEREARVARIRARETLLALAQTPAQRQVLSAVVDATPWAGGAPDTELRYTALLDRLAPRGDAATEMGVHRALWTLAERRVLSVSPHGLIRAEPLRAPLALPSSERAISERDSSEPDSRERDSID